jgi:hypothetical protein
MTTRYQEKHYEDVAKVLSTVAVFHNSRAEAKGGSGVLIQLIADFATLFAADNPPACTNCAEEYGTSEVCVTAGGRCHEEHNFEGGFNRTQFLAACGLETS